MKYLTRGYIADDAAWEQKVCPETIDVIATDEVTDTGLLDERGRRIFRVRDRVGFLPE